MVSLVWISISMRTPKAKTTRRGIAIKIPVATSDEREMVTGVVAEVGAGVALAAEKAAIKFISAATSFIGSLGFSPGKGTVNNKIFFLIIFDH